MDPSPATGAPISEAEALNRLRQLEDPSQRYYAAWWLGRMRSQHPEAIPLLLQALNSALNDPGSDPDLLFVARNATRALGKLQSREALGSLLRALAHPDHGLREAAARSLGELGDANAMPALLERLQLPGAAEPASGGLRLCEPCEALLEALGDLGCLGNNDCNQAVISVLESFTEHSRPVVRCAACRALLQLSGDQRWAEPMLELLQDAQLQVRRAALMDLGASGWRPAGPALANCLAENSLKLIALRDLLEHPLGAPPPHQLGGEERDLLNLMDQLL